MLIYERNKINSIIHLKAGDENELDDDDESIKLLQITFNLHRDEDVLCANF